MRISDWSSDVCSSDLPASSAARVSNGARRRIGGIVVSSGRQRLPLALKRFAPSSASLAALNPDRDRKRVVSGKSVTVRVDLGGCRYIKTKTLKIAYLHQLHNK